MTTTDSRPHDAAARFHALHAAADVLRLPNAWDVPTARLVEDAGAPATEPDIEPVGDPDLLTDLGISSHQLLTLCAHEGLMPADVTAEVCVVIGCGDQVEELRE